MSGTQPFDSRKWKGSTIPSRNQIGQTLGTKGSRTLRRLIDATATLLATTPLRELRIVDITRVANTSAATFYVYFKDVDHAVLAVIQELSQSTPELLNMLAKPWPEDEIFARAVVFATSYMRYWRSHRSVFHARNLAADEGDHRFTQARNESILPLLKALTRSIARNQQRGELPASISPGATAGALIAMLERIASVGEHTKNNELGITPDSLVESAAYILASAMHGQHVFDVRPMAKKIRSVARIGKGSGRRAKKA